MVKKQGAVMHVMHSKTSLHALSSWGSMATCQVASTMAQWHNEAMVAPLVGALPSICLPSFNVWVCAPQHAKFGAGKATGVPQWCGHLNLAGQHIWGRFVPQQTCAHAPVSLLPCVGPTMCQHSLLWGV